MAGDNWEMPKPIFRTSEGRPLGVSDSHDQMDFVEPDTLSPDFAQDPTNGPGSPDSEPIERTSSATTGDENASEHGPELRYPERIPSNAPNNADSVKKSGFSFATVLLLLLLLLSAVALGLYYVLLNRQPVDTTF